MGVGAFGVLAGDAPLAGGGWVCGHGSCAGVSRHLGLGLGSREGTRFYLLSVLSSALWKEIQNKVKGVLNLPNLNDLNAHLGFLD